MNNYCLICGNELITKNSNYHETCLKKFFGNVDEKLYIEELEKEINTFLKNNFSQLQSVCGVQKKISLTINITSKSRKRYTIAKDHYIIKFIDTYEDLPIYEHMLMNMAKRSMIHTVEHGLVYLNNKELIYITKRIDRKGDKKFPMEDFCQLLNKPTEYKYDGSYEYCYKHVIAKYSCQDKVDTINFFNVILFSYLTGNTDLHLKNFSLINKGEGYKLSDIYDLVPCEVIVDQNEMALSLNGKRTNLRKSDFLKFGIYCNLDENIINNLISRMISYKSLWLDEINHSLLSERKKKEYIEFINDRINFFLN